MADLAALARSRESRSKALAERLRKLAAAAPKAVDAIARSMFIAGSDAVITGTPVDTGRLRYGWNPSVGEGDLGVPPEKGEFGDASAVQQRAHDVVAAAPQYPKLLLTNAVEHAAVIELGGFVPPDPGPSKDPRPGRKGVILVSGGFSTQAPAGMLAKGVAAVEAKLREFEGASRSLLKEGGL